jgi:hypothetical protein
MHWRAEPVNVEKFLDEAWVGVKGQSNREIARTPRNVFGNSLRGCLPEVELPIGLGGVTSYQIQTNSECRQMYPWSEGRGAKVPIREGKNPDHRLRPPSVC